MIKKSLILLLVPITLYAGGVRKEYSFLTPLIHNGTVYVANGNQEVGAHSITYRTDNLSNSIYCLRMIVKNKVVKRFIIAK